jgi:hypothetical protein
MSGTGASQTSILSIGRLLPRLMLLFFLLDLVLRFVPLDPLTFRAWEAMLRHYQMLWAPSSLTSSITETILTGALPASGTFPLFDIITRLTSRPMPMAFTILPR